jgi:hypothetical protein
MNRLRREWRCGDPVIATVVEILDERELILRFGGGIDEPKSQIMRVANETRRGLRPGDQVQMRVVAIKPLRFQYIEDRSEQRRRGRLDVSI